MKDEEEKQGRVNNHGGITIIRWIISFTVIFCNTEETFNERREERSGSLSTASAIAMIWEVFIFNCFSSSSPASRVGCLLVPPVPHSSKMKDGGKFRPPQECNDEMISSGWILWHQQQCGNKPNRLLSTSSSANLKLCWVCVFCDGLVTRPWCFTASLPENTGFCWSLSARWIFASLF